MANSVQRAFDIAAEDYDRARRRLVRFTFCRDREV